MYVLESDTVTVLHDFTSDASRLIAVLNRYLGNTSVELARSEEKAPDFARTGIASLDADTEAWLNRSQQMVSEIFLRRRAQLTTDALEGIANHLAGVPGRKNLVWVSAAFPFVVETDHGPQIMNKPVDRATRAINSADIAVYPVDIRGLIPALNPTTATATVARGARPCSGIHDDGEYASEPGHDADDCGGHRWQGVPQHQRDRRGRSAAPSTIHASRTCSAIARRAPTTTTGSGTSRSRSIAAASSCAIARDTWPRLCPSRDSRARLDALQRVLLSPIEASSVALAAEISRIGKEGTVVVRIDPAALSWEQKKDVREAAIDVVIAQSVPDGKYFTIKETTVNLTADPERYQQMLEDGLTLSSNFTAVPDAYRLHVVVSDVGVAGGRIADHSDQIATRTATSTEHGGLLPDASR